MCRCAGERFTLRQTSTLGPVLSPKACRCSSLYTRFVGLVIGLVSTLVTGLSNTIARCAPTSRGRSSGWSFCATPTLRFEFLRYKPQSGGYADPPLLKAFEGHFRSVSLLCQSASSIEFLELLAAMAAMEGMEGMEVMGSYGGGRTIKIRQSAFLRHKICPSSANHTRTAPLSTHVLSVL